MNTLEPIVNNIVTQITETLMQLTRGELSYGSGAGSSSTTGDDANLNSDDTHPGLPTLPMQRRGDEKEPSKVCEGFS